MNAHEFEDTYPTVDTAAGDPCVGPKGDAGLDGLVRGARRDFSCLIFWPAYLSVLAWGVYLGWKALFR